MASTTLRRREAKDRMIIDGFVRDIGKDLDVDIPLDIIQMIFTFFFIKIFNFEYSTEEDGGIEVDENTITHTINSSLNTVVVGDWMDPEIKSIHSIKMKVNITAAALIGIVPDGYKVDKAMIFCDDHYSYSEDGEVYNRTEKLALAGDHHGYSKGDELLLTLDFDTLSLSCQTVTNSGEVIKDILVPVGVIKKMKYKWAFGLYGKLASFTVIDIS